MAINIKGEKENRKYTNTKNFCGYKMAGENN